MKRNRKTQRSPGGSGRRYQPPRISSRPRRPQNPERSARLADLAAAQLASGPPEAALPAATRSLILGGARASERLLLGEVLYRCGEFDSASAWLSSLQQSAAAQRMLGRLWIDRRDLEAGIAALGLAISLSDDPAWVREVKKERAAALAAAGRTAEALEELDAVISGEPGASAARLLRASVLLQAGEATAALADLDTSPPPARSAEAALLRTRALELAERPPEEIAVTFQESIERHPHDARLRLGFARFLASQRGTDPLAAARAEDVIGPLLSADPASADIEAEACLLLADLLAGQPDRAGRAEALYLRAMGLLPDDPRAPVGLAGVLRATGQPERALPLLLRAALVDPERSETATELARALAQTADDEAVERWLGLLVAGLPRQAPRLLAGLLRSAQEAGRSDAYEDVRRLAHRMKNRVAVLAARAGDGSELDWPAELQRLFDEWSRFLSVLRQLPPAPRPISVERLVNRAVEQALRDPRRLQSTLPAGLPLLRGDEEQLVDALANLLRNAEQASPAGRPVRLVVRHRSEERLLELLVSNEGPGLTAAERARLFEPGYTRKQGGSGIGLAVVWRAALAHGGRVTAASAPGGPTTFTLRLPTTGDWTPRPLAAWQLIELSENRRRRS